MVHVVLSDEQVKAISQAKGDVEFRDASGQRVGYFWEGWTAEEIARALASRNSNQRRYTTAEVLQHLQSLDQK